MIGKYVAKWYWAVHDRANAAAEFIDEMEARMRENAAREEAEKAAELKLYCINAVLEARAERARAVHVDIENDEFEKLRRSLERWEPVEDRLVKLFI